MSIKEETFYLMIRSTIFEVKLSFRGNKMKL